MLARPIRASRHDRGAQTSGAPREVSSVVVVADEESILNGAPGPVSYSTASGTSPIRLARQYTAVGFGLTGNGVTGGIISQGSGPIPVRRQAQNVFDAFRGPRHQRRRQPPVSGAGHAWVSQAVTPEPATWATLGTGLVGLAAVAARRRRAA